MESDQNLLSSDLQVDSIAVSHLKETAGWSKFLGITGMVISIIIGIMGLFAGSMISSMNRSFTGTTQGTMVISSLFITLLYLFIAVVYFFLSLFLFRFATKMKVALQSSDQMNFNDSLFNLKLVYRTLGIITVIYLGLIVLAMIVGIGAAVFMGR